MCLLTTRGDTPSGDTRHIEQAGCQILALGVIDGLELILQFLAAHEAFGGTLRFLRRTALI